MEHRPKQIADIISALIAEHWTRIEKERNDSDEGAITVSLSIKIGRDGKNIERAKVSIAYGVRVKDEAGVQLDDPAQTKLEYTIHTKRGE